MISAGGRIVDGISFGMVLHKNDDGEIQEEKALFYKAEDGMKEASYVMSVTGEPVVYVADETVVASGAHTVTGTVTPVTETVHLSTFSGKATPELLKENEIAAVQPDAEGNWSCDVEVGEVSRLCAWIAQKLDFSAAAAELTIKTDSGSEEEGGESSEPETPTRAYTISTEFSAEPNILNGATHFAFYANVSGPSDMSNATLYATDPDSGEETLIDGVSITGGDGAWIAKLQFDRTETPYTDFRMTGTTDEENGEISVEVTTYEATCLSGDTLITLEDGTDKRMDALTDEDIVLGGDMRPARIIRLARGHWNTYHILYHFDDGTTVDEVHEHRFYNVDQGFWQKLKNWRIGDRARRQDGGTAALVAVERIEERKEMFGLWVERDSYWANGLLSGDAEANLPLLCDATAAQAVEMAASLPEREIAKLLRKEMET